MSFAATGLIVSAARSGEPSGNDTRFPERMSGRAVLTTTGDGSEYPGESASNR